MHFMVEIVMVMAYGFTFSKKLPDPNMIRGMIFSIIQLLMAQILAMPMMAVMNKMPFPPFLSDYCCSD